MKRTLCILIIALIITSFAATGCRSSEPEVPTITEVPVQTSETQAEPTPAEQHSTDVPIVLTSPTPTLEPTEEPASEPSPTPTETTAPTYTPEPTGTPVPTETPAPTPAFNPYVGIWTIEDLPFSLELRDDGTYLASIIRQDKEGTYAFNAQSVTLYPGEDRTLELRYYAKADILKFGEFKLIRDDLVFFQEIEGVPVNFTNENEDIEISVRGAVVEAKLKDGKTMQSYCFTASGTIPSEDSRDWFDAGDGGEPVDALRVFKHDGQYTLWTRDAEGNEYQTIDVTVASGFFYPFSGENVRSLIDPLKSVLKSERTSVDELNRRICRNIAAAGFYTRAGVVTSGVSLVSEIAKYGYSVPHQVGGSYDRAKEWGVDPTWGKRLNGDEITSNLRCAGMHDAAAIVWAYKQAGMNIASDLEARIGLLGERQKTKDNLIDCDRGKSGDIVHNGSHYQMIIDRIDSDGDGRDDAYLTYEFVDSQLTVNIMPFRQAQKSEVFSMDAVFDGTGRNVKKLYNWKEHAFRIPIEVMPQYMQESIETEKIDQSYRMLMKELGFYG